MSKHLGNILEPMPLMDEHGADAVRWFMAASGSPWAARRVGHGTLQEIVRKVLLTYWNTVAFQALYARTNGWTPDQPAPAADRRPVLDRWLLSQLHRLTRDVTEALENFDTQRVGSRLAAFVDDLSNWYVRRSRRRFWDGDPAALSTLHETLHVLTRLMAPLTPFVSERVWQDLFVPTDDSAPESVHLARWPEHDAGAHRRRPRRRDGTDASPRRARTVGPFGGEGEDPPAAAAGADPVRGARASCPGAAGRGGGRAQRRRRRVVRLRRRPGRPHGEGQLPQPGQAVRQADAAGGGCHRGRRRDRARRRRSRAAARRRSTSRAGSR